MCIALLFYKAFRQVAGYSEVVLMCLATDHSPSFHIHLMLNKILLQTRMQNLQTQSNQDRAPPFWILLSSLASSSIWRETWGAFWAFFHLFGRPDQSSCKENFNINHYTLVIQTFLFQNDRSGRPVLTLSLQASVVQTLDSAIQRINHYPAYNATVSRNTYLLDSDLSGG